MRVAHPSDSGANPLICRVRHEVGSDGLRYAVVRKIARLLSELQKELKAKKTAYSNLKIEIKELQAKIAALDTSQKIKGIAVNVEELKATHFEHFFKVNGSFEAVKYAYISPQMSGQITQILVKEGQAVETGELLLELDVES